MPKKNKEKVFKITPKGQDRIAKLWEAPVTSSNQWEFGLLRAAEEGLLERSDIVVKYGTEGAPIINKLLKGGYIQ